MAERALAWVAPALLMRRPTEQEQQEIGVLLRRYGRPGLLVYLLWIFTLTLPGLMRDRPPSYHFVALFIPNVFAWIAASATVYAATGFPRGKAQEWIPGLVTVLGMFLTLDQVYHWFEETSFALAMPIVMFATVALVDKAKTEQRRVAEETARRLAAAEARLSQQARARAEAELRLLQGQVEPHFLYNTLANLRYLVQIGSRDALRMTDALIDYLRASVPSMRAHIVSIGQDAEQVRHYLAIMQMRMQARLSFTVDIDESVRDVPLPPLLLLTLVENAVKHGIAPQVQGGTIAVSAQPVDGRVRIEVTDTGAGLSSRPAVIESTRAGLANVRDRLRLTYGHLAELSLTENDPRGARAVLQVPNRIPGDEELSAADAAASAAPSALPVLERAEEPGTASWESWIAEFDGLVIQVNVSSRGDGELWINDRLEDRNRRLPSDWSGEPFLFAAVVDARGRLRRIRIDLSGRECSFFADGRELTSVARVEKPDASKAESDHRG